jgi:ligand-binding sensor domain-containing protein
VNLEEEPFPFNLGPGGLLAEGVSGVYQDKQGNTWLVGNGAARSHGSDLGQWDLWYWQNSILPSGFLSEVGEDAHGNIYIGGDFVAYRFDGIDWSMIEIGNPSQFSPIGFHNGLDGNFYATRIATVYRHEGGAFVPVDDVEAGVVSDLAAAPNGDLWLATSDGVERWTDEGKTIYTPVNAPLAELNVTDVEVREDGLVAVLTYDGFNWPYDGGLAFFDGTDWTAFDYGESALPFYQNGGMTFDANGDLWFASVNYGVVQVLVGDRRSTPRVTEGPRGLPASPTPFTAR